MKKTLVIVFSGIVGGLMGTVVKLVPQEIPALSLNFFRMLVALITLLIVIPLIDKKAFKIKKADLKDFIFMGFLIALASSTYILGFKLAPVSNIVLITSFHVVFVAIFAYFILKEKLKSNQKLAIFTALIALIIINPFNFNNQFFQGNMVALSHALINSLLIVYLRKQEKIRTIGSLLWFILFACIFLVPTVIYSGIGTNFLISLHYIIFIGIIGTALPTFLIAKSLKKLHADTVAIILLITTPISAIVFATLILHEIPSLTILIGGPILILSGIILHYVRKKQIRKVENILHLHHI